MKDIIIKIERKTSQVFLNKKVLGINGENLQGNIVFEFLDQFVDGIAWLELETKETKGYLLLTKENNTYKLPILSSLLAKKGYLTMQLRITESENVEGIPVFKSNEFYLEVKGAINSTETIEEQYPSWVDMVNEKINVIKTDGKGNKYLSDDGTYKYVEGGGSNGGGGDIDLSDYATKDEIPTKTSQLTNDSGFLTNYTESDPTVPSHVKAITQEDINKWNNNSGGGTVVSGGLSTTSINLLITVLKNCLTTTNQTSNIDALELSLKNGGGSSGGNTGGGDNTGDNTGDTSGITQTGTILSITGGVNVTQAGTVLSIA